jgi:hypothetical protein
MTEQEVARSAFDLIFAFDEIVALGYRESVTLQQIRTFIAMDSHDENLYKMVKKVGWLAGCLSVCLVCLSVWSVWSVCLSVCLSGRSVCRSVCLSVCLVCLSGLSGLSVCSVCSFWTPVLPVWSGLSARPGPSVRFVCLVRALTRTLLTAMSGQIDRTKLVRLPPFPSFSSSSLTLCRVLRWLRSSSMPRKLSATSRK